LAREFALIAALRRQYDRRTPSIVRGIGDDAAIVRSSSRSWTVLTTDLLAEGVHFDGRTGSFVDIGYRAAVANLSDIAAMGAIPQFLLMALAIPPTGSSSDVQQLFRGVMAACRPYGTRLIGGDTSASNSGWFVSLALSGTVAPHRALLRKGASPGDLLYVTGTLGDSLAGLKLLNSSPADRNRSRSAHDFTHAHRQFLIRRHLRPTARVSEGRWLSTHGLATAAIDLSDGLSGDLRHLCEESGVGAKVDLATLPLSPACRAYGKARRINPCSLALTGGEDYELLMTVKPRHQARLEREARQRGFRVTWIGTIEPAKLGIRSHYAGKVPRSIPFTSYEHFR
jgi:thiamine-monophosphate kinase